MDAGTRLGLIEMGRIFTKSNLLYALFLLVFTLVLAEVGARWYLSSVLEKSSDRKFQFDAYRIYAHVPGFTESDDKGVRLSINQQGFRRTTPVEQIKPPGTFRIFFLGGSAAHGISSTAPYPKAHVRDNETVDAYLEVLLRERFPDKNIEVINAAVTGYKVFQHTAYITEELLNYQPDLFIFFDGYNDHYAFNPFEDEHRDNIYQFWTDRLQHPTVESIADMTVLWASNFSGLARGYYALKNNHDADQKGAQLYRKYNAVGADSVQAGYEIASEKGYLRSIRNNLALAKEHDIGVVLCLQPGAVFRDPELNSPMERDSVIPWLHDSARVILQPLVLADLERIATKGNVPFFDLNPSFNDPELKGQQLFLDYCHLTPKGGEVAAKAMVDVVAQAIDLRLRPNVPELVTEEPKPIP